MEEIVNARDVEKRIVAQQKDLIWYLNVGIKLRKEKFTGRIVVEFLDGKAVDIKKAVK